MNEKAAANSVLAKCGVERKLKDLKYLSADCFSVLIIFVI